MRYTLPVLLMLTTALAGCARIDEEMGSGQRMSNTAGYRVSVDHAESLESFAQRYSVAPSAIIQANHLQPPYRLQPHESLIIPPPAAYVVQSGDTVQGISNILGVDERSLANANGLQQPYQMRVGQILTVPGGIGGDVRPSHSMAQNPYESPTSEPGFVDSATPPPPRSSISAAPLAPPPGVQSSSMNATFSAPTQPVPAAIQPTTNSAPAMAPGAPPRNLTPPPEQRPTSSPTALAPTQAAPSAAPPPQAVAALPAAPALTGGEPHFHKPVAGAVVLNFGADSAGQINDGINIAAPAGTPVQAAEAGTVIYTGNELAGFGNLILVRHSGGWVTAYGHLATMTVQRGATVTQGQPIGTVGQTGTVSSPQLHFEIRQGSKPVDPAPLLKG